MHIVIDFKAKLQKAKDAVQLAKEVAEAEKQVAYAFDMEETQARLTEEFVEVCRDYYDATWDEALNVTGGPADSA